MGTFNIVVKMLENPKANRIAKRRVIKNDTVIVTYKNRLYQMSQNTGVRYPYVPTNADLRANDWLYVSDRGNVLVDQSIKEDAENAS